MQDPPGNYPGWSTESLVRNLLLPSDMFRHTIRLLLKRAAGPCVGVIGGLALANGLFSWWQEQDWQVYRASAKTRGMILDLPDDMRQRLPAEENLAANGPFASVRLGHDGKPVGARQLPLDALPYDLLPVLSTARPPNWEKAGAQSQLAGPLTPGSALQLFEEKMGAQWQEVLAAEAKPETHFYIRHRPAHRMRQMNLLNFRVATQAHAIRAVALLEEHRPAEALEEIRGVFRLCDALRSEPTLDCTLVRAALMRIAMEPVWHGVTNGQWSEVELGGLEALLADRSAGVDFTRALDHERAWINALIDELLNTAAPVRGRLLRKYFDPVSSATLGALDLAFSDGYVRANQIYINRYFDSVRGRIDGQGDLHSEQRPSIDLDARRRQQRVHTALAETLLPNVIRAEKRLLSVEARLRQARLAIAIERYRQRTQTIPSELELLVPDLLHMTPGDPFTGNAMRYRVDQSGGYRLWSVGCDGDNDGALPDPEDGNENDGDLVWTGIARPEMLQRTAGR